MAPNIAGHPFGNIIHPRDVIYELCHPRIIGIMAKLRPIELRKVMTFWLLQSTAVMAIKPMSIMQI